MVKGLGPGGAERLLCSSASAHDHGQFEIECAYVLTWKDHLADELERAGVRTCCLSTRRRDRWWPIRLARLVRSGEWDIVHTHSPLPAIVARCAVRTIRKSRRPTLVSTEHNRWATHRLPTRVLNRITIRWCDTVFAVTDEVRASMAVGARRRTRTLQHGIDLAAIATAGTARAAIRDELGIAVDELVIGTVANFRPQKDYPNLLAATRLLADRNVPVRLVAVGQGPQEDEVRALHRSLDLGQQMLLTGFRDDAVNVMGACDIFTLASKWEGLPVAVMEALALGLPIVATQVGGVAEALTNDRDALLVPPGDPGALADALQRVVEDRPLRLRLAAAAVDRAADFDVSRAVTVIERAYGSDVSGPVRASASASSSVVAARPGSARRSTPSGLDIRPAGPDDRAAMIELCRTSLGWGDDPRFEQLFSWKHDHNVFGPSYMWVATDGERLVGLRAFMRWEFLRGDTVCRAVRAVDTATHPDYQGRGLFTAMTVHALDEVGTDGVDFVFNTPNDQSRPGYLKMGWSTVGRLPVAVRVAGVGSVTSVLRSRGAAGHWPLDLDIGHPVDEVLADLPEAPPPAPVDVPRSIRTRAGHDFYRWRFGAGLLGYRAVRVGDGHLVVRLRSRRAGRELVVVGAPGLSPRAADEAAGAVMHAVGATHCLRLGSPDLRRGFMPAAGAGPTLTWRSTGVAATPALANWQLTMGDIELF